MTVEHKDIPNSGLHEPLGVSGAAADRVYVADGAGSGAWEPPKLLGQGAATLNQLPFSDGSGGVDWRGGLQDDSLIMVAASTIAQNPTALDVPLQVVFGALQATTEFDMSAAGALTCNVSGTYHLLWNFRFSRTSSTGTAKLLLGFFLDGTQIGRTLSGTIEGAGDVFPFSLSVPLKLTAGQVLTISVMRDSTGNNDGGLAPFVPAVGGWSTSSSASTRIDKIGVI